LATQLTKKQIAMNTNEILTYIKENGGFDNFRNWNNEQKKDWVKSTFNCSNYIAKKVSEKI
jgi:phosphoserine aminotransferase